MIRLNIKYEYIPWQVTEFVIKYVGIYSYIIPETITIVFFDCKSFTINKYKLDWTASVWTEIMERHHSLRAVSDLAGYMLTYWLTDFWTGETLKPHSSYWRESRFNHTKENLFFLQQRKWTFAWSGWTYELLESDIYWRLLGNPVRFPSKEFFLETGTRTMKYQKKADWPSVCSFTSQFLFLPQRCQRRARPKQMHMEQLHKPLRTTLHFYIENQPNKMTRSMYCKKKKEKKIMDKTNINYIYLFSHAYHALGTIVFELLYLMLANVKMVTKGRKNWRDYGCDFL